MRKLFVVSCMLLLSCGVSFASNLISVHTDRTFSGDTGKFAITMKNDVSVSGLNFILRYDPAIISPLKVTQVGRASLLTGSSASLFGGDKIDFIVYDAAMNLLVADSGKIFEVEYVVNGSLPDSISTPLIFTEGLAADSTVSVVTVEYLDGVIQISPVVGVRKEPEAIPAEYKLFQNYPNPFNSSTKIRYQLRVQSQVSIKVFDVLGRFVDVLIDGVQEAGYWDLEWNASGVSSGVYFARMVAENSTNKTFIDTKKLVLLK